MKHRHQSERCRQPTFAGGTASWEPAGAVAFYGARPGSGPSAEVCCGYLRFFASRATALNATVHLTPGHDLGSVSFQVLAAWRHPDRSIVGLDAPSGAVSHRRRTGYISHFSAESRTANPASGPHATAETGV